MSDPLREALRDLVETTNAVRAEVNPRPTRAWRAWLRAMERARALVDGTRCAHCGAYVVLIDWLVPYHDYPPPCRSVCPGSKNLPLAEGALPVIEQKDETIDPKSLAAVFGREELTRRCGKCDACTIEQFGCGCDGAYDDGCFFCTPGRHTRPECPSEGV